MGNTGAWLTRFITSIEPYNQTVLFVENEAWDWNNKEVKEKKVYLEDDNSKNAQGMGVGMEENKDEDLGPTTPSPTSTQSSPSRSPSSASRYSSESPPKNVRSLAKIYERCNVLVVEPESFEVAAQQEN